MGVLPYHTTVPCQAELIWQLGNGRQSIKDPGERVMLKVAAVWKETMSGTDLRRPPATGEQPTGSAAAGQVAPLAACGTLHHPLGRAADLHPIAYNVRELDLAGHGVRAQPAAPS